MKRMKYYKKIFSYFNSKKLLIFYYFIVAILISIVSFFGPYIDAKVLTYITNVNVSQLLFYFILSIFISLIMMIFRNYSYRLATKIRNYVSLKIKEETSKELFNLEIKNFDKEGTNYFTSIIEDEPNNIAGIFEDIQYTITTLLSNIGVFVYLFMISPYIGILIMIIAAIDTFISKKRMKNWKKYNAMLRDLDSKYSSNFAELIHGMKDIKVLNLKDTLLKKTINEQNEYHKKVYEFDKKEDKKGAYISLIHQLLDLSIIILSIYLIYKNLLDAKYLLIIYMYRNRAAGVFRNITSFYEQITKFNFSIDRLYGIVDGSKYSKEKFGNKVVKKLNGNISIKNLDFSYDNQKVLNNLCLDIKENTTVGIVGKSGSGKTTIFNLLSKLYSVPNKKVYFDNYDINDLSEDTLRNNISIITQNPYLFNMSIKENLKIVNPELTDKEMIKICKMCCIHDFIMSLPDKYDTIIGENGTILSGGQKQRLTIARSIIKKSKIILLDEATSALDNETQDYIQNSINNFSKRKTILIIAHRLSTVIDCDKIFFIDKGKVIAEGTHEYLVENCSAYKNLYKKELS